MSKVTIQTQKQGPFPASMPAHPPLSHPPGTNPIKTVQEPNFYSLKNYINTEFNT